MSATRLANTSRRLPGLRFEAQSPPLAESLPRMDIAVFVGFAASGPVNQPVVIEDSAQFAAIFGEDAKLAWDLERGEALRAYLGPAVREFFRNGGRRCWIIRVAEGAKYNHFPVPALLEHRKSGELLPAFARARSEGSWSDGLRVGASLNTRSLEVTKASFADYEFELSLASPSDVQAGDLLRFQLREDGYLLFCFVKSVQPVEQETQAPPPLETASAKQRRLARRRAVRIRCHKPLWCKTRWRRRAGCAHISASARIIFKGSPGPRIETRHWCFSDMDRSVTLHLVSDLSGAPEVGALLRVDFGHSQLWLRVLAREADELPEVVPALPTVKVSARVERMLLPQPMRALTFDQEGASRLIEIAGRPAMQGQSIRLSASVALADAPAPGSLVRVDFGRRQLWLTVREVNSVVDEMDQSSTALVQIEGEGFWLLTAQPELSSEAAVEAERLTFELLVREGADNPLRLGELGFEQQHPRYWADWPTDEQRYEGMETQTFVAARRLAPDTLHEPFPLAGRNAKSLSTQHANPASEEDQEQSATDFYLPLAMPLVAEEFLGAVSLPASALKRDGLATFNSTLFLDSLLTDSGVEDLLAQADYLRYQRSTPHSLKGIHAALGIEEATLIAVPDAVHRGWTNQPFEQPPPEPSEHPVHPEWWRFLDCDPPPTALPTASEPAWENFLDCDLLLLDAPELENDSAAQSGTIELVWSSVEGATRYLLEESRSAAWNGAEVIYTGEKTRLVIYGRSVGDFYYRVRAEAGRVKSDWSAGIAVRTSSAMQWQVHKAEVYEAGALVDVHRALLRLCAARGDIFALLALPEHYREDDAITHAGVIRPATGRMFNLPVKTQTGAASVMPLSLGEERATSYGALYHPWLITRRDDRLSPWQSMPPDGAACGVLSQRALSRGAWIAPANELLRGVVALAPPLARARWQELQDAQVNIFRHEPRGFLSLSADTLSSDPDLRPINVRRLLILLRRLALRLGATYVFEPNDDSFRRLVQRGFEAALDQMFARGAFAGRTAATSYQVITDASVNTPASVDQGRFIVELRVAPSLPLTFITVRMVQTNDRSTVTEGR